MTKPEIIGSARSTYTWAVCMVCEEKGIEYSLMETPLRAPEIMAIHPLGRMPVLRHGESPTLRIESDCHLSRSQLPWSSNVSVRSSSRRAYRAVGLPGQYGDRPHVHPDICLRVYRAKDHRWRA